MKRIFLLVAFAFVAQCVFCVEKTRNYSDTVSFVKTLDSNFSVTELGLVKYSNCEYPVYKISYNPLEETKGKKCRKYLIISGVHGNEPAPVFAVKEFLLSLNNKEVKRTDLQIDFVLVVNPFGFEYNQRYNGDNADINRDLTELKTQEARLLVENFKPRTYDKVFDFHEANASGFFLYCYGNKNSKLADRILKELSQNDVVFDDSYKDKILTVKNGKLFVPFYASAYMNMNKTVTTGIYYSGCKNSFTFETSKNINLTERKRIIKLILEFILNNA